MFIPTQDFLGSRIHEIQHVPRDLPEYLKQKCRVGRMVWLLPKESDFMNCSVQIWDHYHTYTMSDYAFQLAINLGSKTEK